MTSRGGDGGQIDGADQWRLIRHSGVFITIPGGAGGAGGCLTQWENLGGWDGVKNSMDVPFHPFGTI